jgi:hypothetical protein
MGQLVKQAVPGTKRHSSLQEASVQASALPNAEALSDEEENLNAYVQALDPVPHYSKEGSSGLFYFGQWQCCVQIVQVLTYSRWKTRLGRLHVRNLRRS